jgi:hypothetical protein
MATARQAERRRPTSGAAVGDAVEGVSDERKGRMAGRTGGRRLRVNCAAASRHSRAKMAQAMERLRVPSVPLLVTPRSSGWPASWAPRRPSSAGRDGGELPRDDPRDTAYGEET